MRICSSTANIHLSANVESENTSQALYGEHVNVLETDDNWAQVELLFDGYTGFIESHHLRDGTSHSTHRVITRSTLLFDQPNIKSPVRSPLPLAAELSLQASEHHQFLQTEQNQFVWKQHVRALHEYTDIQLIDSAQALFLGSPYLWGGRSPAGLDCSALVQLCALLQGWRLPRDTHDQVAFFRGSTSDTIKSIGYAQRQPNDLVYWPGHVAIVIDQTNVVHATAHSLQCCREPLKLIEARAGKPESIWRLAPTPDRRRI